MTGQILNCGYVPLVDCAPLIIAKELGFAGEEGLELNLVRQPSWSALRDMLALGHLDAAQMLSPMPIAMSLGMGGLGAPIDTLMALSVNGTVFGVSPKLAKDIEAPFGDAAQVLEQLAKRRGDPIRIGIPFPYSMHRLLMSYWSATNTSLAIDAVTVPPPRMADAVEEGHVDAFWVGEPWGSVAVQRGIATLCFSGRDVWQFAPEKVLAARKDWVAENPKVVGKLMRAIFGAAKWLDSARNKPLAVEILARSEHLNLSSDLIDPAVTGQITPSLESAPLQIDRFLQFHRYAANFPWRSQAAWIAQQLGANQSQIIQAKDCFRTDLYRKYLKGIGADMPGASEKIEGSLQFETAVSSSRGHMILAPDAFFDGNTFDFELKT